MIKFFTTLYLTCLKIGVLAFGGGYAAMPLIERFIVKENGWLQMSEFVDLVSISQMTPGPIAINAATFVGQKVGHLPGAFVATLGVVTPQFILMMIFGHLLFTKGKKFKVLDWMLNGVKAGIVALILITALKLIGASIFPQGLVISKMQIAAAITFIIGFILYFKKLQLFQIVGIGAVLGIAINLIIVNI